MASSGGAVMEKTLIELHNEWKAEFAPMTRLDGLIEHHAYLHRLADRLEHEVILGVVDRVIWGETDGPIDGLCSLVPKVRP
jgi:hypothetical protein